MVLMRLVATTILLLVSVDAFSSSAEPRISFYERDPWLTVIGSDSPIFAAYDSGTVIWWSGRAPGDGRYESVSLSSSEYNDLVATFSAIESLSPYYEFSNGTDQPTVELYVWVSGVKKSSVAYGSLGDNEIRIHAPSALVGLYDYVKKFHHERSEPWSPEYIEVMVWPFDYAKGELIHWPQGWPDTTSPSTQRRKDAFSIYLPYSKFHEVVKLMSSTGEASAIEINGKKWAADIRIPFPHEYPN